MRMHHVLLWLSSGQTRYPWIGTQVRLVAKVLWLGQRSAWWVPFHCSLHWAEHWQVVLWGDIGLARNMCKFQPHKPGPTQTPCAPPVRELWVACSATQELPTRPSYAPKTLEQKRKSVGTKKAVLEVLGQKKFTLDTQVTHWHTASKRCQPAWLQTYRDWRIDRWIGGR